MTSKELKRMQRHGRRWACSKRGIEVIRGRMEEVDAYFKKMHEDMRRDLKESISRI